MQDISYGQIIDGCFKSVTPNQQLPFESPDLPGIANSKIIPRVSSGGILFPVRSEDGKIVQLQMKPDDVRGGKYKPASSGGACKIADEMPLNALLVGDKVQPVKELFLVEGHGLKSPLAHYKLGINVLAANGGYFTSSPKHLGSTLKRIANKDTKIILCPDGGDVTNKNVTKRWLKQAEYLTQRGYAIAFAWWGQIEKKTTPDIDELTDLSNVEFISTANFEAIVAQQLKLAEKKELNEETKTYKNGFGRWDAAERFTADAVVNEQSFAFLGKHTDGCQIIAVKSPMGSGKTLAMIQETKKNDMGTHSIGTRNALLLQIQGSFVEAGLTNVYHASDETADVMMADDFSHHFFCFNSINTADGYFHDRTIIIDEAASFLAYALGSKTISKNERGEKLAILAKAFQDCKKIYLLDAHLSDLVVDFIASFCPGKKVVKIENTRKPKPHELKFVDAVNLEDEIKQTDKSPLVRKILEEGCKPFIVTDSKKCAEIINQLLTASGRKGCLLTSETIGEPWAQEFLKDPNTYIKKHQPDFFVGSPSIESGVSITEEHFTHKFSLFCGVLGAKGSMQMMFRNRLVLPHWVFCPRVSVVQKSSGSSEFALKTIMDELRYDLSESIQRAGVAFLSSFQKVLQREDGRWVEMAMKLAAHQDFEHRHLRSCLVHLLKETGHTVIIDEMQSDTQVKELYKEAGEMLEQEKAQQIFDAIEYDDIADANRIAKGNPTRETQRAIEKTRLLDRLPGMSEKPIWSPEFILNCHLKDRLFIWKQTNFWCLENIGISGRRHVRDWEYQLFTEHFFSPDHTEMRHNKVWALNELKITDLIGVEYHKNSEIIIEKLKLLRSRKDILRALDINPPRSKVDGSERLETVASLLSMIGFANIFTGQKITEEGTKLRHYKCLPEGSICDQAGLDKMLKAKVKPFDFVEARLATLECINTKMMQWIEKDDKNIELEKQCEKELKFFSRLNVNQGIAKMVRNCVHEMLFGESLEGCEA